MSHNIFDLLQEVLVCSADGTRLKCTCSRPECHQINLEAGDVLYKVSYVDADKFNSVVLEKGLWGQTYDDVKAGLAPLNEPSQNERPNGFYLPRWAHEDVVKQKNEEIARLKSELEVYKGPRLTSAGAAIKHYQEQIKEMRDDIAELKLALEKASRDPDGYLGMP